MANISEQQIKKQLAKVKGPDLEGDIVSLGMVSNILIDDAKVIFSINVPAERAQELEPLREAAEKTVLKIKGVTKVMAVLTGERGGRVCAGSFGSKLEPGFGRSPAHASTSEKGCVEHC